jgi:hypothetical protein
VAGEVFLRAGDQDLAGGLKLSAPGGMEAPGQTGRRLVHAEGIDAVFAAQGIGDQRRGLAEVGMDQGDCGKEQKGGEGLALQKDVFHGRSLNLKSWS